MLKILLVIFSLLFMNKSKYKWMNVVMTIYFLFLIFFINMFEVEIFKYKISTWMLMDSISFLMILLTMWIMVMMILVSFKIFNFNNNSCLFIMMISLLFINILLCFLFNNMIMFYVFFESSLIPIMFIINKWGVQLERYEASMYLFMYTIMGSLPMLCSFIYFMNLNMVYNMNIWYELKYPLFMMWFIMISGFLVKLPMFPFHLWLPKAHVEAPISGSIILASILLKLGSYGIYRILFLFPYYMMLLIYMIYSISLFGGLMMSLICFRQTDLKSLIAYSSISHMSLLLCGMLSLSKIGFFSSTMMMIAHGFSASAMFFLSNINYDLCNTRNLILSKSSLIYFPVMNLFWFLFIIMNMASPPYINLFSEVFILVSIMDIDYMSLLYLSFIMFFTVCYSLHLYSLINHGMNNFFINSMYMVSIKDLMILINLLIPSLLMIFNLNLFFM